MRMFIPPGSQGPEPFRRLLKGVLLHATRVARDSTVHGPAH
jgi:hypothetical protein